ncbi:cadherin-16 isoform X2 [Ambystoma mexicanum]
MKVMYPARKRSLRNLIPQVLSLLSAIHFAHLHQRVEVPENYDGLFPLYLMKINLTTDNYYNMELSGNEEGIFGLDPESGFLFAIKALDRETKASYTLQVTAKHQDEDSFSQAETIEIIVKDKNDNEPHWTEDLFYAVLSKGTKQGVSFLQIIAADPDDSLTANADLRYKIISQVPKTPSENMFAVDPRTGAISLTEEGSLLHLSSNVDRYQLDVQVKDMGDESSGYFTPGEVLIEIVNNTWFLPIEIQLQENLNETYPKVMSTVHWNSNRVHYHLDGSFAGDVFSVDGEGNIYVNQELDREYHAQYMMTISAVNDDGVQYGDPLELMIIVTDENDNPPVFHQKVYSADVREQTEKGTEIARVEAEDGDDPNTDNANISYTILSQEPSDPNNGMFHVDKDSGIITLQDTTLSTSKSKQYILHVVATDLGGSEEGLSDSCIVIINVVDVNDSPPQFLQTQYGPFIIPEDAEPGMLIATIAASDEDEKIEFYHIRFSIESGNEDGTFKLDTSSANSTVSIILEKKLDYEGVQAYTLVITARNDAELHGAVYGNSSTATVYILVGNINEAPVLTQTKYEVSVPESLKPGTVLLTVKASDPDVFHTPALSYSLKNDSKKWLSIDEHSGEIQLRTILDRETGEEIYIVQVIAQEKASPSISATAEVIIHILDVNDNSPLLVGDYSGKYLCTPQRDKQSIIISAFDHDSVEHSIPFIFTLANDHAIQRNWRLNSINDTHAFLTMGNSWLEPKVHVVPIIITDSGKPPQKQHIHLPVTICICNDIGYCMIEVEKMEGMPTVFSAVGIIVGTLGAIGLFLLIIFGRLSMTSKEKRSTALDTVPLKSTA